MTLRRAGHLAIAAALAALAVLIVGDALSTLEHGLEVASDPGGPTLRGTVDMHVALAEVFYESQDE